MDGINNYKKVCITLPNSYTLFNPSYHNTFGGWEVRISLIAKELAKRKTFDINIVVGDYGQPHIDMIDGVRLYSWTGRELWGIPSKNEIVIRNPFKVNTRFYWYWFHITNKYSSIKSQFFGKTFGKIHGYRITPEMVSIYDEINADIYLVPGNTLFSAEVAYYCKKRGKKYIFQAGSDLDYSENILLNPKGSDIYSTPHRIKKYSIDSAHLHIVQNENQSENLNKYFGRKSVIINNPIDLTINYPKNCTSKEILWVGKSDERVKRPSIVLEIAKRMPMYKFIMIMNRADNKVHNICIDQAKKLQNVIVIEQVPLNEIENYFSNARIYINTSSFEGFPNTYLQAAKYGVPIISLRIDPNGMLSKHSCGFVCDDDINKLEMQIAQLMENDDLYNHYSQACSQYVRKFHDKDIIIDKYIAELTNLTKV